MVNRNNYAFDKTNFILLAVGMIIVIIGFILMSGSGSSEEGGFNPEIFSAVRIKVAPVVSLVGFLFIIYAIMHTPKTLAEETPAQPSVAETASADVEEPVAKEEI